MAKELTILAAPLEGCYCVDLEEDADVLPHGWHFILRDNCYTGWSGGSGGIRFAEVELIEEPDGK